MIDNFDFESTIQKLIEWKFPSDMCIKIGNSCYYDIQVWYQAVDQIFFLDNINACAVIDVLKDAGILERSVDKGDNLYRLGEDVVHKILCL